MEPTGRANARPMINSAKSAIRVRFASGYGTDFARRANHFVFSEMASPAPFAKIFPFASEANQFTESCRLVPLEGRIAIVTDAGRDAVDAGSARDEWC